MDEALIDTDILSEVLKARNATVLDRAAQYLQEHGHFAFSAMTYYEILRGFRATRAVNQLSAFVAVAATSDVLPISLAVLDRAADLWAEARSGGHPHNDADLVIASTAVEYDRVLVSGNLPHFTWIEGLRVEDWRRP